MKSFHAVSGMHVLQGSN